MGRYKIVDDNGIYFTSLKHCQEKKGLTIFGYVIMLTHFHVVAQTEDGIKFHEVMRDMKRFTSKEISQQLESDGQKLFLHVFKKAAERSAAEHFFKEWLVITPLAEAARFSATHIV